MKKTKKIVAVLLTVTLLFCFLAVAPSAVSAVESNAEAVGSASVPNNVYVKQQESVTCTLAAATNMLRARFYLSNNDDWQNVTESSVHPSGWTNNQGLNGEFNYSYNGNSAHLSMGTVSQMSVASLKWLLDEHPEGVVIYSQSAQMHAVLATDYVGDTFYCVDSDPGTSYGRVPLSSTTILGRYGSQANILANITKYWVISNYNISPTNRRLDIGSDFYGLLIHQPSWIPVGLQKLNGVWNDFNTFNCAEYSNNPAELVQESRQTYARTLWHFQRGSDNAYTITSVVTGEQLSWSFNSSTSGIVSGNNGYTTTTNKWFFSQNGEGYTISSVGKNNFTSDLRETTLCMTLPDNNTAFGTRIRMGVSNKSDSQRFAVFKLDPTRDKLNYSISASTILLTQKGQKSVITIGGTTNYAYRWSIYMITPYGSKLQVALGPSDGFSYTFELTDYYFLHEGTYTFYAELKNPFGNETGSLTTKCAKVTVRTSTAEGDFSYRVLDDGTADITAYNGTDTEIVFPATIAGRQVSTISGVGEAAKQTVESVVIPEVVTNIYCAFSNCKALKSAHVPASVGVSRFSSQSAFSGCSSLENVTLEDGLQYISDGMFSNTGISRIIIPNTVKYIGCEAFNRCKNLKDIYIPENAVLNTEKTGYIVQQGPWLPIGGVFGDSYVERIYGVPGSSAETYVAFSNEKYGTNIQFIDISTIPHEEVVEPGKPATCTEEGLTDRIVCSFCGEVLQEHETIPKSGHNYRFIAGTPATYTSEGLSNGVQCANCGDWAIEQTVIPKLVSNYSLGDVNRDGKIDIRDVTAIQRYIAEINLFDSEQVYLADIIHNDVIVIEDASLLQMYLAEYAITIG